MATIVLDEVTVTLGGTDLSDHIKSITLNYSAEELDDTAMGDSTRSAKGGLKQWGGTITFHQDYAASEVDATLFALVGTTFSFVGNPDTGTTSTSNPQYTGTALATSYNGVIGGSVGDLAEASLDFTSAGDLSRATS